MNSLLPGGPRLPTLPKPGEKSSYTGEPGGGFRSPPPKTAVRKDQGRGEGPGAKARQNNPRNLPRLMGRGR